MGKSDDDLLWRWGKSIKAENGSETRKDTGAPRSIFGALYQAIGVMSDEQQRDRADAARYKMDMEKVGRVIDGLGKDTRVVLHIKYASSENKDDGLRMYCGYANYDISMFTYKNHVRMAVNAFNKAYV